MITVREYVIADVIARNQRGFLSNKFSREDIIIDEADTEITAKIRKSSATKIETLEYKYSIDGTKVVRIPGVERRTEWFSNQDELVVADFNARRLSTNHRTSLKVYKSGEDGHLRLKVGTSIDVPMVNVGDNDISAYVSEFAEKSGLYIIERVS